MANGEATIDTYLAYLRDVRRLSGNTIESYGRDLAALAAFAERAGHSVDALSRRDLEAFARQLMSTGLSPRSVARTIACIRGYYRFLLLEKRIATDPAEDLSAPRAWPALPKYLDLEDVDRLLSAPDPTIPRGLRDKALIELLYATGLRVSELLSLRPGDLNLDAMYLTCIGKGDKQRIVPLGHAAADWIQRYTREARPALLKQRKSPWLFVNAKAGGAAVAGGLLEAAEGIRHQGGGHARAEPARAATFVRDTPSRTRRGSAGDPDDARARRPVDHPDLHARAGGAPESGLRQVPSAPLTAQPLDNG